MSKIKVFIADDHAIVRQGLKQIISDNEDLEVAAEAGDGIEALQKINDGQWDVVVLDISMPGMSGIDILKRVNKEDPDLPILILSTYPAEQYALRVLKSGASGYLTKESAPEELVTAICKVAKGQKYISPKVAELLSENLLDDSSEKMPHELLTDREYQVMCQLASGKTVSEVADDLSLSVKTISTHRKHILDKMQMKTNAELTHYAIKNNLVY